MFGVSVEVGNGAARFRAVHTLQDRRQPESEQGYEFTSQLYFHDALTHEVQSQGPYAQKGQRDLRPEEQRRWHRPRRRGRTATLA